MKPRIFRMTIASVWYSSEAEGLVEFEAHYKVARRGRITKVRKHLAKRGLRHFQSNVYRWSKRWPPKRRVRISFEREASASKGEATIKIEVRRMKRVNHRWKAEALPSRTLSYAKKKRRRKE